MYWQTTRFRLDLGRPRLMGIVNVTPDSFSDGGRFLAARDALAHCERLVREGADLLDLGAESSRPGADPLPAEAEWARLEPVLREALTLGLPVSVDTCKPEVMRRALDAGADIINDIRGLCRPGAAQAVAAHPSCGVCVMHMQGDPATMQHSPHYEDVVAEVKAFCLARVQALEALGVARERVVIDPGIGFGKRVEDNLALLARQRELLELGCPVLVGWSRKSTLGTLCAREVGERLAASVAAALLAAQRGAAVLRVHDVAATRDALTVWQAVEAATPGA
jgi:dihydropteroate synthase